MLHQKLYIFKIRRTGKDVERTMKRILQRYEMVSGQAINYNKSSVTYSPNTSTEDRGQVCSILAVQEVSLPTKYLGMPMVVGRNKSEIFEFLIERVGQKLQGWGNVVLSKGGKLVLLKTAAQAIPNFWMSLFMIPSNVCDAIEKKMNGFLWGHGANGRGIRWMSWDKVSVSKYGGGLGVRCLKKFNTAMLAKHGWRIMNEENPLVTKIMKARYFPNTDFLNAELGASPSYMWRSILSAQEAVKSGCRRRIGDGSSTRVWQVPWLPSHEDGYLTTVMPQELKDIQVQNIMDMESNDWDQDMLNDLFNIRDRELIRQIPIPMRKKRDTWFWLGDDKGKFSVRSVYRWLQGMFDTTYTGFWKKIWNLKISGKVINFMWRACQGCLPTLTALEGKKVIVNTRCTWCHSARETDIHVLFECDFAKTVWTTAGLMSLITVNTNDNCLDVFDRVFQTVTRDKCALIAMICWGLWHRRNKWVWEHANGSAFGVRAAAVNMLSDWSTAREVEQTKTNQTQEMHKWSKPPVGWVKINIDAAVFSDQTIGVGAVIRNEEGQFMRARNGRIAGCWQPREAEALNLKDALSWSKTIGLDHCIFETDSKILVRACKETCGDSYFHTIVEDYRELCKHYDNVLIQFIRRSANSVAHLLATYSMSGLREWVDNPPENINHVLSSDSY